MYKIVGTFHKQFGKKMQKFKKKADSRVDKVLFRRYSASLIFRFFAAGAKLHNFYGYIFQ
jgi:hypothetical protein